jgi:hypothetical protein
MHYHGYTGIGGGYVDNYQGTFPTKKAAQEWLRSEKDAWADFAADSDPSDPVRLFGNVANLTAVGIEGAGAFYRASYVEPCPVENCQIEAEWDENSA